MAGPLFIALMGASVAPAVPISPNEWFNSKDSPKTALRVAESGPITYTIDVAPDGSPVRCYTVSMADLDQKVCEIVMKRARFQPARDEQGRPAFGVHERVASFLMPGRGRQRPDPAKLVVSGADLPAGVSTPAHASVAFVVDRESAIGNCGPAPAERRRFIQVVDALSPLACERLARDYRPAPARNAAGEAVTSVQSAMVRFEASPAR